MCCDSGSSNPNQDPQVGAAAMRQANTLDEALAFSKQQYEESGKPLQQQMIAASKQGLEQQNTLYNLNLPQAQAAADQNLKYGLPAQEAYYKMVNDYSAPEYQEQQARMAMGDVANASASQQMQTDRALAARGIDPTSGAAVYARGMNQMGSTAMAAAASNRARMAAQQLGMTLKQDSANFGRGGYANVGAASGVAGGAASGGFGIASGAIGANNQAGAGMMQGYGMAANGYGQQMSTYMNGAIANQQSQAQESAGLGGALGTLGGAALRAGGWGGLFAMSDRRLKTNITRVGTLDNGLPVYEFCYVGSDEVHTGCMADEVEKVVPAAVMTGADGFKRVNYSMVGGNF